MIIKVTIRKALFLERFDNMFILVVLALKLLNIPMKMNKAKKAVMKYLLLGS